ncbi:hypothetical protein LDENG_00269570 [Lucifuga dentata]|nr:hypothetical protein LDENG_00269570 [Lucifuga dentata]
MRDDVTADPSHSELPGNLTERTGRLQPSVQPEDCGPETLTETTLSRRMEDAEKGSLQHADPVPEVGEDAVTAVSLPSPPPGLTEDERKELQEELTKVGGGGGQLWIKEVEDEIQTLSQVLAAKEKQLADIKRKLGISPLNELRQNISKTWQDVTTSVAYRRTSETLTQASQKATAAFSNMGSAISRKLEDVRNAPSFKSFEERVGTLKPKTSPSASSSNHGDLDSSSPTTESLLSQPEGTSMQESPTH